MAFERFIRRWNEIYKEKTIVMDKALNKINKDVDIVQILKKMKEIDKLKDLLLEKNQRTLLEFFPKPIIKAKLKQEKKKSGFDIKFRKQKEATLMKYSKHMLQNDYIKKLVAKSEFRLEIEMALYIELFKAYRHILNLKTEKEEKTNQKLIFSLGESMLKLFNENMVILDTQVC
jgi:hypothetical protein